MRRSTVSIINDRTGRHEDDLHVELMRDGSVPIKHLIEHLNEIVVEDVSGQPANVRTPVKMASLILEQLIEMDVISPFTRVTL
jgi:hypothetical protein